MCATENESALGSSAHYSEHEGRIYFDYQKTGGMQRGRINARKFASFIKPSDVVLDYGCGNGSLLLHLDCHKRIGVEANPSARKEAEKHGLEVHEGLSTVPNQCLDAVVSNHALEHVLCPVQSLRDLRDKLLIGGRLVICVPIGDWRTQRQVKLNDINHHLYTWTPLLMGNLLDESGYHVERVWVYTHAWPPTHWQKLDSLLPVRLFDVLCTLTALRFKRRQIMALASNR